MPEIDGEVVNNEAVKEAAATEATTVETQISEESEVSAEPKFETIIDDSGEVRRVEVKEEPEELKDTEATDSTETETETPKKGAEARKEQLASQTSQVSEEIREMVAEKNRLIAEKQQVEQELAEMRATADKQQLPTVEQVMRQENPATGDFYTEFEAKTIVENLELKQKLEQAEQQRQADVERAKTAESIRGLADDANRALRDFPIFDEESPDYDETLAKEVDATVQSVLIRDGSGNPIGAHVPVYQLYKMAYDAAKPKLEAEKSAQKAPPAKATADVDFRGSGQATKKDFKNLSLKQMEAELRKKGQLN